ncbi:MAG: hypothetical protein A2W91_01535 [Bacteroidetes bacterium GWF2_38_335]|nr:MAG: hypothetical protein A2W91_01535 [Bacteroidetes bacterium GWF2_38_335]OFY78757.1 MAG: hypothetical protein A2281_19110 [Bacteroidetes bacterium RIFOXYA12_FULL_38_20]HBS85145.1 hypothetical protein [Bacteroidales bacterium]
MKIIKFFYPIISISFFLILSTNFLGCNNSSNNFEDNSVKKNDSTKKDTFVIYTLPSRLENTYLGFNSPLAINRIAEIENEYFNNYKKCCSKYYGTMWYESLSSDINNGNLFENYKKELLKRNEKPDSMHCTIYAIEALKVGLDTNFSVFEKHHQQIWNNREYAGWSVAYILTTKFNWKAYLIISEGSNEYNSCLRNFSIDGTYHVWKQPSIPLKKILHTYNDKEEIDSLLKSNEFGWGFSDQGYHTWITRFDELKECNWVGTPSAKFDNGFNSILFLSTKFSDYFCYTSHVIVFPQKK